MKALWSVLITASLVLVAGCATSPAKPESKPAPIPQAVATPPAPAPQAEQQNLLPPTAAQPPAPFEGDGWEALCDGKTLAGWRETQFAGRGEVLCQSGAIILKMGDPFTGLNFTNDFPKMNYEVALDAMRVTGSDFFCGLTVPVGTNCCSLIVGGWGGSLVGISSLDGMDASENETTKFTSFDRNRWYRIRLRVTANRLQAWIDKDRVIDVDTTGKRISVRPGDIELSQPFGLAAWQTTAAFREMKYRRVDGPAAKGE